MDPASFHTGCPVIKGIKWGAPLWIHIDEFEPQAFYDAQAVSKQGTEAERMQRGLPAEPGLCQDFDERCAMWAKAGECTKNPGFMVKEAATCRKVGLLHINLHAGIHMLMIPRVANSSHLHPLSPKSCGECSPCDSRDWECINANRKSGGYLELNRDEMEWLGVPWWMNPEPSPEL